MITGLLARVNGILVIAFQTAGRSRMVLDQYPAGVKMITKTLYHKIDHLDHVDHLASHRSRFLPQ
jgi:hypothetical protein